MTRCAILCRLDMVRGFAHSPAAVMATGTVARDTAVIEAGAGIGRGGVTGPAIAVRGDMASGLAGRLNPVVA